MKILVKMKIMKRIGHSINNFIAILTKIKTFKNPPYLSSRWFKASMTVLGGGGAPNMDGSGGGISDSFSGI